MIHSNRTLKPIAWMIVSSLLGQQVAFSAELRPVEWAVKDSREASLVWAKNFLPQIPESIATIEDAWHSSSTSTLHTPGGAGGEASAARNEELHEHSGVPQVTGPGHTVILIQDAHTNNSGQLNEAKLLDILYSQKKNLSNYIFLEAGSGSESLSFLRKYASLEKRQQVAKSFLLQAKLQGTEYLDLTSDHNMTLWGVEDMTLYSKSVELYRRSAQRRQKFSDYLDRVDRTIRTLEPKFLNPYLLVFYQKLREHEQGKLSLQEYLGLLFNEAQKLELTGFKNLKVLQDLKDKEKEINFEEAQKEQAKFITSLSTQEQKEFLEASRSKDEQVHKAFLFLLSDKLKENTAFPNLQKYLTYFKYSQTLNPQEILREQKLLEEKVLDSLITTPDEKELIHASEGVAVLKKLFLLQCTPEDYQTYKKNKSNLSGSTLLTTSIQKITGFLNQKLMNQKDNYDKALFLENGYEDMVRYCEEFYELTYQRDQAFISNMLEVIESTKHPAMGDTEPGRPFTRSEELHEDKWAGAVAGPVAAHLHVLITGGYHTPNLKHLLKQNNISYISLTPQVLQETNLKRYEEILLKQKMPAPFQPANLAHTSMTTRVLAGGRLAELTEALGMKIDQGKWIEDRGWRIEGENQGARLAATSKPESNSPNEFKPSWIRYVAAVSIIATASVLFLNFGVGAPFLLIRPLSITVGNIASMFIQQEKNTGRYLWRLFLAASGGVASTLPVMGYFLLLGGWDNPDIGDYWMKPLADILGFSISANLILFLFMSAKDIDFTKPYKTWIPDIQKEFVRKLKAYFAPKGFYEINTAYWGPIASFCYTIATRSEMELNVVIMAVIYSLPLAFYAAKDPTKKSDGWKQATLERTYLLTPLLSAAMVPLSAWNGNWVGAGQWSWILLSGLAAWGISIGVTRWFIPKVLGIDLNPEKADRTSEPQAARLAGKIEKRMKGRGLRIEENQAGARLANDGSVNIEGLTPLFLRLSPVQAQRETAGARLAETSGKERPEWYLEDAVTDLNEALEVLLDRYVANDNSTPQSRLLMNRLFDRVGLLSRDISRMVEQQSYLDVIPLKNQVNRIHEKLNAVMQVISRTRDITRLTFFEIQLLVADDGLLRSVGDDLNKFVAGARLALHKNLSDIWWALLANVFENDELWPIKFINTKIGTNGMVQIANDVPFSIRRELKILKMQNLTHVLIVHDQNNPEELLIYPAEESDSQRGNFFNSPRPLIGAYYLKNEKMVTAQSIIGDRLKESKQLTKEGEIPKAVLMRVSKKPRKNRIYLFSAEKGRKVYLYSKKVTLGDLLRVEVDSNRMLRVYRLYPGKNRYEILAKGRLNKKGKFLWVRKKEGDSLGDKKASAARLADSKNKNSDIVINRQVDENLLGAEWANILAPSDFESGNEWTVLAVFRQTGDRFEGAYTKNNLGKHQQLRKQLYGKKPPIGISIYLGNESAGFLNVPFHIEVDPYQRLSGKQVKRAYFKSLIIVNDFLRNIIEKGYIEDTENPSLEVRLPNADDPGGALQKSRRMGIREASEIARRELALLESERVTQAARLADKADSRKKYPSAAKINRATRLMRKVIPPVGQWENDSAWIERGFILAGSTNGLPPKKIWFHKKSKNTVKISYTRYRDDLESLSAQELPIMAPIIAIDKRKRRLSEPSNYIELFLTRFGFESIPLPVDYPYLVVMKKFPQVEFIPKGDHGLRSLRLMPEILIRFILGNNAVEVSLLASGHVKIEPVGQTEISSPSPQGAEIGFLNVAVIGRHATNIQNAASVIVVDAKNTISKQHLQMMPVTYFGLPFLQVINLSENQPVKINNAAEAPTDDPEPPQPSDEFLTLWAQYTKMLIKEPRRAEGMLKRLEQDYRDRVSAQLALEAENKPFGVRLASATSPTDSRHPQSEIQGPPIAARLAVAAEDFTPDDAVEFLTQVFGERHGKTGRLWIGSKRFRSHFDQKTQELVILGFGRELLRTKDWKTKRAASERHDLGRPDTRPMDSVGISLSDFKILLQNSFDAVKDLPANPALDQETLVVINLESLNPKLKGFDGMILPHLIRELAYAQRHSSGKKVKYLLTGRKASKEMAAARLASYFKSGQDWRGSIFTERKTIPAAYKRRRVFVTDPDNPRRGRNFYIQMPEEGDILNFRATLRLATWLARIKELNVNDPDFAQFKQIFEKFLGRPIDNMADFIAAIEAASKNRSRYSLPVLVRVSTNLALAAARLANSMTEQSA